jgi:hypothetical protein
MVVFEVERNPRQRSRFRFRKKAAKLWSKWMPMYESTAAIVRASGKHNYTLEFVGDWAD